VPLLLYALSFMENKNGSIDKSLEAANNKAAHFQEEVSVAVSKLGELDSLREENERFKGVENQYGVALKQLRAYEAQEEDGPCLSSVELDPDEWKDPREWYDEVGLNNGQKRAVIPYLRFVKEDGEKLLSIRDLALVLGSGDRIPGIVRDEPLNKVTQRAYALAGFAKNTAE
jgi:hypothetical protein